MGLELTLLIIRETIHLLEAGGCRGGKVAS